MKRRTLAGGLGVAALLGAAFVVPATAQDTTGTVHFVQGVPDTVDVCVDDAVAVDDLAPDTRTEGTELEEGTHDVAIVASDAADCADAPLFTGTFDVTAGTDVDAVVHYDADMNETVTVFGNNTDMTANGEGRITLRHAADAGAVDATVDTEALADALENGQEASDSFPGGEHTLTIYADDVTDTPLVTAETIALAEGSEEVRYLIGSADDDSLDVLAFSREVGETPDEEPTPGPAEGDRISGDFREDTAVEISQTAFADGAPVVYIAGRSCSVETPSCGFADALAGKSLQDGPILLNATCGGYSTDRDADADLLYDANAEEIQRLDPDRVVALGGPGAVCDDVLEAAVDAANADAS